MKNLFILVLLCWVLESYAQDPVLLKSDSAEFQLDVHVESADDWNRLFTRSTGWFGGDGIYTIPIDGIDMPGRNGRLKTLFIFSDTMFGQINDGKLQAGSKMVHNSVAIVTGNKPEQDQIHFYGANQPKEKFVTVFTPETPHSKEGEYYWLGDGFVNHELDNTTYIFGYRIRNTGAKVFGFEEVGNTLIAIPKGSKFPFINHRQIDTPFFISKKDKKQNGSFGAGILANTKQAGAPAPDGFIYVYGVAGSTKEVLVARVLPKDFEDFTAWTYWDGSRWNKDIDHVTSITDRASNELSVTPLADGRYALVFQIDGIGSSVGLRVGLSPKGPFGPIQELWQCPEVKLNKNYFVYNAKAHPHLSKKGELLISYNVNSFDFLNDLSSDPHLYRPRFIRVQLD